jgi:hypothetical protein
VQHNLAGKAAVPGKSAVVPKSAVRAVPAKLAVEALAAKSRLAGLVDLTGKESKARSADSLDTSSLGSQHHQGLQALSKSSSKTFHLWCWCSTIGSKLVWC